MEQQLTTTSILALFNTNSEQRKTFINSLIASVEAGDVDPLKIHYELKCIESIIDAINKNKKYKQAVLDAAQKYGSKPFEYSNALVETVELGTKFDWSKCNDQQLVDALKDFDEKKKWITDRQEMLKKVDPASGMLITDEQTGDTFKVCPPTKTSTTGIKITLK